MENADEQWRVQCPSEQEIKLFFLLEPTLNCGLNASGPEGIRIQDNQERVNIKRTRNSLYKY